MKNLGSLSKRGSGGFTLVEILTVIAIIGILAGVLLPAVMSALRTSKETAIRTDVDVMSQAMEAYKLKYGDYPPDFFDWNAVETHFRKAFRNIDDDELRILAQFTHYNNAMARTGEAGGSPPADPRPRGNGFDHYPHAIDRAEALVFCLGGFSSDEQRPFTGQGGPLVKMSGAPAAEPDGTADDYSFYQYNPEREEGFFDFENLTLGLVADQSSVPFTYSTDEQIDFSGGASSFPAAHAIIVSSTATTTNDLMFVYRPDPFPVYLPPGSELPVVYFNSRSYPMAWGSQIDVAWNPSTSSFPRSHHFQNVYLPVGTIEDTGVARPYASTVVDTTPPGSIAGIALASPPAVPILQFAEDTKFQLVSAGLDDNYGGAVGAPGSWGSGTAGICIYPSGQYYNPFAAAGPSTDKYQDDLYMGNQVYSSQPQLDNVTNFTTRTLESDLP